MLYCGEQIGNGTLEPQVDIAVDPLDGTTSIAMVGCCSSDYAWLCACMAMCLHGFVPAWLCACMASCLQ